MLLLWIICVISVLFCYAFMYVCLLMPCGHLLGKGWPLGSPLWCLIVTLSLSHWYPWSGVVLDCIDSWSLPSFLLLRWAIVGPAKDIRQAPTNRFKLYLRPSLSLRPDPSSWNWRGNHKYKPSLCLQLSMQTVTWYPCCIHFFYNI